MFVAVTELHATAFLPPLQFFYIQAPFKLKKTEKKLVSLINKPYGDCEAMNENFVCAYMQASDC